MRETVDVADRLRLRLASGPGDVVAAYLFGSTARGAARADSDVDVGVWLTHAPPPTLDGLRLDMAAALEQAVERPVQLVVLNGAPCDLVHRVLRDGVLLLDRDPSARIRFEVKARREYLDLKPFLDRYRGVRRDASRARG